MMGQTLDDILGDVFDSRDITDRLTELEQEGLDTLDDDNLGELNRLRAIVDECSDAEDWQYGETFIRDSYFQDYARDLADDIGAINDASWPNAYIDWEAAANALKMDYTSFDIEGTTYWAR